MKYIGIDYGSKHIGISVSDEEGRMAFPLDGLENTEDAVSKIEMICKQKEVEGIVLGESKDFQGKDNPIMEEARAFAKKLEEKIAIPTYFQPEFMTSVEARHIQGGGEKTHSSAAAIILQSFLDTENNKKTN